MRASAAIRYYSGTLISSIGSFTFNICLVAFMARAGYDLFHVSLILGLQRLVPILITGGLGHLTDRVSPKKTVVLAEVSAAGTSVGILWAWSQGQGGFAALLGFCLIKSSIAAFQMGSRAKLTKLLADDTYASNAKHAIWFNKATQGATLFAGICAWPIIQHFGFETAIWFDLLTFVANGCLVGSTPFGAPMASSGPPALTTAFIKFREFYQWNPRAALLDLLLAISMMGTTSFTARLAGDDPRWVAILMGSYGFSVWFTAFVENSRKFKVNPGVLWAGLGASYFCLGAYAGHGAVTLAFTFCKDTFYWLLLHRISSHIQADTPQSIMGSVTGARTTQMVAILATGELLVGAWSKTVPIFYDGLWRGIFCFAVLAFLSAPTFYVQEKQGYAKL